MRMYLFAPGLALLAAALLLSAPAPAARAADSRTAVAMTADQREFILQQMRAMLASVQGVTEGLAAGNAGKVEVSARTSGMAAMNVPPALRARLPKPFVQLAMGTHKGFDAIAEGAAGGAETPALLERLGTVLGNCLACHAAFRIEVTGNR